MRPWRQGELDWLGGGGAVVLPQQQFSCDTDVHGDSCGAIEHVGAKAWHVLVVDAPVTRPVSQQQLYVTVALHFGVKVSDAPQGAWAQAGAAAWPAGTCAHASRVFSEVIGALWPWLATAPDPSPGASQQQLYAIVALQRGLDVSCGVHCSIPPAQACWLWSPSRNM